MEIIGAANLQMCLAHERLADLSTLMGFASLNTQSELRSFRKAKIGARSINAAKLKVGLTYEGDPE